MLRSAPPGLKHSGLALLLAALASPAALALETDQYYAWGRHLDDSAAVLNAKFNLELDLAVDEVNRRPSQTPAACHDVAAALRQRMHFTTFQELELWVVKSDLVSRVPADPVEELEYRRVNLYHNHGPFDMGTWLPDSPTIEVDGIRFGTDKLAHFVSSGWRWYESYLAGVHHGLTPGEAEQRAIRNGVFWERTMLGMVTSGVLSPGDLEADYRGMQFFRGMCEGEDPTLTFSDGRWQVAHPVDLRLYVSPEWDESYQNPFYSKHRWRKVEPVLRSYCERLGLPEVQEQRARYARRDHVTPVEKVLGQLVALGKLPDPAQFSIEVVCGQSASHPSPLVSSHTPRPEPPTTAADDTELMEEIARREADRITRAVGFVALHLTHPEWLSGSIGGMWVDLPREYDCRTVCSFQGPTLQLAAGYGGGRASFGWARVVGDELGGRPFVLDPYIGFGVKGTLLYTWGQPIGVPTGAAYLGPEFEFTIVQVSMRLGVLYRVGGTERGGQWLLAGGMGWGF